MQKIYIKYCIMENRIKDILSEKGMTAKELSQIVNISVVSLYNIINGKQEASANTLKSISSALSVPFWQLFVSPNDINNELEALIKHKGQFYEAHTIKELETLIDLLKNK